MMLSTLDWRATAGDTMIVRTDDNDGDVQVRESARGPREEGESGDKNICGTE